MNIFVFDIETIPDIASARRIYHLDELSDDDVLHAMTAIRQQENGSDFQRHFLHKIVAISVVLSTRDRLNVWSLGEETSEEKELISRFFAGIERYTPTLVSWNGGGFDLPVLHYRAMLHKITASRYWELGEHDTEFRWNNYLNRFHLRHLDLMDILSGYQTRAVAPLDQLAAFLGFPGKMGMSGSQVLDAFSQGQIKKIRDYCETDVLNTYLVFLNFQLMRGHLDESGHAKEISRLQHFLQESNKKHFSEFLTAWENSSLSS